MDAAVAGLPAGVDGEAVTLAPPLQFRVVPLELRVRLPPALQPRAAYLSPYSWPTIKRLWAVAGRQPDPPVSGPGEGIRMTG